MLSPSDSHSYFNNTKQFKTMAKFINLQHNSIHQGTKRQKMNH